MATVESMVGSLEAATEALTAAAASGKPDKYIPAAVKLASAIGEIARSPELKSGDALLNAGVYAASAAIAAAVPPPFGLVVGAVVAEFGDDLIKGLVGLFKGGGSGYSTTVCTIINTASMANGLAPRFPGVVPGKKNSDSIRTWHGQPMPVEIGEEGKRARKLRCAQLIGAMAATYDLAALYEGTHSVMDIRGKRVTDRQKDLANALEHFGNEVLQTGVFETTFRQIPHQKSKFETIFAYMLTMNPFKLSIREHFGGPGQAPDIFLDLNFDGSPKGKYFKRAFEKAKSYRANNFA